MRFGASARSARQAGVSGVEFAIAIPVMLLLGLSIWQWALIMQARQIVDFAVREGARAGSLQHAEPAAIEQGLVSGLAPLWVGNADLANRATASLASLRRFTVAERAGWVAWRQLSPTRESFADWGSPQADAVIGSTSTSTSTSTSNALEIPIDNFTWRARQRSGGANVTSADGVSAIGLDPNADASRFSERTGPRSGQTLREAIVLRVELTVGVPLVVPLAGRFISWAASLMSHCSSVHPPRLGSLRLEEGAHSTSPVGGAPGAGAAEPDCAMFSGPDDHGRSLPRLPLRVIAEAQMQSAARQSNRTPGSSTGARANGSSSGSGGWSDHSPIAPREGPTISAVEGPGADSRIKTTSVQPDRQAGFLQMGGEREIWAPGSCGIPPS